MKVLFLTTTFPSLSETFILNQVTGLLDRGHDVTILARTSEASDAIHQEINDYALRKRTRYFSMPDNRFNRVRRALGHVLSLLGQHPLRTIQGLDPRLQRRYFKTLEAPFVMRAFESLSDHFDVLHAHFGWNGILGAVLKASRFYEGPLITSFYGSDARTYPDKWGRKVYESVFEFSDIVTGSSKALCEDVDKLIDTPSPVKTVYTGVPTNTFEPAPRTRTPSALRIISVGRLVACKGFDLGIRAVARALEDGADVRYELVGEGPMKGELNSLIRELGLSESVHLTGSLPREAVVRTLQQSDVFLAPSVTGTGGAQDSIGTSLLEAMSCALPVVASDLPSIREVIKHRENGFITSCRDVDGIAERIQELSADDDLRRSVGTSARKYILKNHSIDSLSDRLESLYTSLGGR